MPLFWVSLAFMGGIILAHSLAIPTMGWSILALLALLFFVLSITKRFSLKIKLRIGGVTDSLWLPSPKMYPLMLIFFALGAIRYQLSQPGIDQTFIAYYNDRSTASTIDGVVAEPPDMRDSYANLRVKVQQLHSIDEIQFTPVHGTILARISINTSFRYGDLVRLEGRLQTPAENADFSYRDYLANQGIYSYMAYPAVSLINHGQGSPIKTILYAFRDKALQTVYSLFPDPEAALLAGILLGEQAGISPQLQEAFQLTGTSHIIVISGFNITIIAGLFTLLFSHVFGRYKGAIFAALGIVLYTLLVGANAAVVRAAILGLLSLLGHLIGRRQAGLNSLTFVAGVMAVITPTVLWDVSFQLSFAATLGIMLYAQPMTEWFIHTVAKIIPQDRAEKIAGPVSQYLLITLAAQITTLPLMVYYFKRLSLTALIANPLILPAQPALMVLGGLAVLTGLIIHPLGQLFAWAAWPFTAYTIRMVEMLSTIPHGSIAMGPVALPLIMLFYAALFTVTVARNKIKDVAARLTPAFPLAILGIATVLIWRAAFYAADGRLHVTVLDVGTGEGLLIQSPDGRNLLINGGNSANKLSNALGRRLPFLDRTLDWLVVADIDDEDLAGVAGNLERFSPRNVLWAGSTSGTRAARDLWTKIDNLSIPVSITQPGEALDLGDGARLTIIAVDDKGAVLLLEWDNFRMLLPMGVNFKALEHLERNAAMRNISAMLLAESGYAPLNPPELISHLRPQVTVLSVAAADRTGLPSPETIQALKGYNVVRTDQNGWIEISTDGKQMWVEVERK